MFSRILLAQIIILTGSYFSPVVAQPVTSWGLSKVSVRNLDKRSLYSDTVVSGRYAFQGILVYKTEIANYKADTFYLFTKDSLWKLQDFFWSIARTACLEQYNTLKKNIIKKYGKPTTVQEWWTDDSLSKEPNHWAQYVADGKLRLITEWHLPTTIVSLVMYQGNGTINIASDYLDRAYVEKHGGLEANR